MICSPKEKNIAGQKFGKLTAIKRDFSKDRYNYWLFECDCGNVTSIRKSKGTNGYTKSCGCLNLEQDISGLKFNRLTAIKPDKDAKSKWSCWIFKCDCGVEKSILKRSVIKGSTKSCGCWHIEESSARMTDMNMTHGMSYTRTHSIWRGIKDRCLNPRNSAYSNYGGRGISVCDRWLEYTNFLEDMGERPEGMSIERVDNNKGYNPENCIWADRVTQGNNRRNNRSVVIEGVKYKSIATAIRETGLTKAYITYHYL